MAGYSVTYSVVDNATKQIDAINRRIAAMRAPMERMSRQVSRFVDVSGLRKVAQGFEWIGKTAAGVLRTLSAIVPVMGAITGAASIAGMMKLVSSYAAWSHELVQSADNIGITTQELQQLQNATRLAGGNADDMTAGLKSLHEGLAGIAVGSSGAAEVARALQFVGVDARDASLKVRSAGDVMKELIPKIAALPDAYDRQRIATQLLGGEGDKLVETFRQSHQSFAATFADAGRYTKLTDEQKGGLQRFSEALGRVSVAFDTLGQQIAATLATNLGPFLTKLAEFVEKHTPDIIKAVDELSKRFAAWLASIKWDDVEAGIDKFIDSLKWVFRNLDTIAKVAEGIAVTFAIAWGVGMVANIAAVVAALAPLSAALAPITAALALIATPAVDAAIKGIEESEAKKQGFEKRGGSSWNPFDKIPHWVNPKTGEDIPEEEMRRRLGADPGRGFSPTHLPNAGAPSTTPPADSGGWLERGAKWLFNRAIKGPDAIQPQSLNLPQDNVQRGAAVTARLASDLQLTGPQAAGITGNLQAESGIRAVQERNPIGGGRGGIGWAQWTGPRRDEFEAYAKANNLDPKSDEANYGFLRHELQSPENARLLEQLRQIKGPDAARQSAALVERLYERPAVSNASTRGNYAEQFLSKLPVPPVPPVAAPPVPAAPPVAAAPPVVVPPPAAAAPPVMPALPESLRLAANPTPQQSPPVAAAPPVVVPPAAPANGAVDVSITHKNPPPNSAVTATGSGSVNVNPVRVEHQDMASI